MQPTSRLGFPPLLAALAALALLGTSCNTDGFAAVSIAPIYGWVDGCNTVRISGHGFAEDATATLGTLALTVATRGTGQDQGYWLESTLPANPVTAKGYADVTVTSAGKTSTIKDAYYYVACPAPGNLESMDVQTVTAGATVTLGGCGLDPATVSVQLVPWTGGTNTTVPITSSCGTATATFSAPALPDGSYDVQLIDATGAVLYPTWSCSQGAADTADTAAASEWCPTLTYGSAK